MFQEVEASHCGVALHASADASRGRANGEGGRCGGEDGEHFSGCVGLDWAPQWGRQWRTHRNFTFTVRPPDNTPIRSTVRCQAGRAGVPLMRPREHAAPGCAVRQDGGVHEHLVGRRRLEDAPALQIRRIWPANLPSGPVARGPPRLPPRAPRCRPGQPLALLKPARHDAGLCLAGWRALATVSAQRRAGGGSNSLGWVSTR